MRCRVWCVLAIALLAYPCRADYLQTEFRLPGSEYAQRARVSSDALAGELFQQLDVSIKGADDKDWLVTDRVELTGLRCPGDVKFISLEDKQTSRPGLLVYGDGDTRSFAYVAQVVTQVAPFPELRVLLKEYHEGGKPRIQFDRAGNLAALTLQYAAMHELPDSMFSGHIIVARTFKWVPNKHRFVAGPWYVDSGAEKALSLADALTFVGSYRLGVSSTYDERAETSTLRFKPAGILRDKLPENLRSAAMVEVVMGQNGILSMRSVSVPKK